MRFSFLNGILIFLLLILTTQVASEFFQVQFGTDNFWDHRGIFFLIFITLFPRLTLLFSSVISGGFFWWLSFLFYPRLLVATLATISYFKSNPFLVVMAWLIAISGEIVEKWGMRRKVYIWRSTNPFRSQNQAQSIDKDGAIEAEFKVKD
jgi:hypothetical protein